MKSSFFDKRTTELQATFENNSDGVVTVKTISRTFVKDKQMEQNVRLSDRVDTLTN